MLFINGKYVKNIDLLGKYFHTVINQELFKSKKKESKTYIFIIINLSTAFS